MKLPSLVRLQRRRAGVKQEDVVAAVPGLTQSTYSRFELGQAFLSDEIIGKIQNFITSKPVKFSTIMLPEDSEVMNLVNGMSC